MYSGGETGVRAGGLSTEALDKLRASLAGGLGGAGSPPKPADAASEVTPPESPDVKALREQQAGIRTARSNAVEELEKANRRDPELANDRSHFRTESSTTSGYFDQDNEALIAKGSQLRERQDNIVTSGRIVENKKVLAKIEFESAWEKIWQALKEILDNCNLNEKKILFQLILRWMKDANAIRGNSGSSISPLEMSPSPIEGSKIPAIDILDNVQKLFTEIRGKLDDLKGEQEQLARSEKEVAELRDRTNSWDQKAAVAKANFDAKQKAYDDNKKRISDLDSFIKSKQKEIDELEEKIKAEEAAAKSAPAATDGKTPATPASAPADDKSAAAAPIPDGAKTDTAAPVAPSVTPSAPNAGATPLAAKPASE